jgi:pimeloyl-ACP methyl ester carboxylesterase
MPAGRTAQICVLVVAALLAGCAAGSTAAHRAHRTSLAAGRMVDVGGYRLWIRCVGRGSPTAIFEGGHVDATSAADYGAVMRYLERSRIGFRVCSYDRAGLGRSESRPPGRVTFGRAASELHALLAHSHIRPPYILAGGSFGGLPVRIYQHRYRREVAGLLFIDAVDATDPLVTLGPTWLREGRSLINLPASGREALAGGRLGRLPLVVITAGDSAADPSWMVHQRRLARLSTNTVHLVALGAWHGVTDQRPELTAQALRELVEAARAHVALPLCEATLTRFEVRCLS